MKYQRPLFPTVVLLIVAVSLFGCAQQSPEVKESVKPEVEQNGVIIYFAKDLKKGTVLSTANLDIKPISIARSPGGSINQVSGAIGKRLVWDVKKGQILGLADIGYVKQ